MANARQQKIAVAGAQHPSLLTGKHLHLPFQDNAALVKRVFVAGVFLALIDLHADHDQIIADFCLAQDPGSELFQFQCAQVPESHGFLLFAELGLQQAIRASLPQEPLRFYFNSKKEGTSYSPPVKGNVDVDPAQVKTMGWNGE
jgi:hypothetical protein